jgi:hypothetical protein
VVGAGLDSRDLLMSYYFNVVGFLSLVANLRSTSSNLLGAGSAGSGPFGLLTIARYQMLIWPRSGLEKWGLLALQGSPLSVAVSVAARTRVAKSNRGLAFIEKLRGRKERIARAKRMSSRSSRAGVFRFECELY